MQRIAHAERRCAPRFNVRQPRVARKVGNSARTLNLFSVGAEQKRSPRDELTRFQSASTMHEHVAVREHPIKPSVWPGCGDEALERFAKLRLHSLTLGRSRIHFLEELLHPVEIGFEKWYGNGNHAYDCASHAVKRPRKSTGHAGNVHHHHRAAELL